ncbi:MAG: hypothetical protein QOF37_1300, partial [Thermoleophilaceae bacterium]|nr:hypothetical protein [Thermoleophilaceae bacterium]
MATSAAATPQPLVYMSYDEHGAEAAEAVERALLEAGATTTNAIRSLPASSGAVIIAAQDRLSRQQLLDLDLIVHRARTGDYGALGLIAPGAKEPENVPPGTRFEWSPFSTEVRPLVAALHAAGGRQEAVQPALSPSVHALATRRLTGAVTGAAIVADLLENHTNYRRDWGGSFDAQPFDNARRQPVTDWIAETRAVLAWDRIEEIHGQILIVGLALLEPALGRRLLELGFLPAIERRYKPPLRTLLTERGGRLLDALATPTLAGYATDTVEGKDLLGIDRDVEALAAIVAARDSVPPLSVGLFGRWGSGKSFFMEQMRGRINDLAAEASTAPDDEPSPFCENVVQIKFNAWHYIDANLWASLAAHIFDQLDRYGRPDETETLFSHFKSAELVRDKAKAEQRAAENRRDDLEHEIEELETESNAAVEKLSAIDVLKDLEKTPEVERRLTELGVPSESIATLTEVRTLPGTLRDAWRRMSTGLRAATAVVALVAVAVAVVAVADHSAAAALVAAVAALAPVPAIGMSVLRVVSAANGPLRAERERTKARLSARIRTLEEQRARAKVELGVTSGALTDAEAAVKSAKAGLDLRPFIEQRASDGEYQRQLGLISVIQRDFDRMSQLLVPDGGKGRSVGDKLPNIDRIVLYIDDLDRCPASLVVEVLQAVHLLLAFKLFVVVVGVDPHWLTSSLSRHHAAMLSSES